VVVRSEEEKEARRVRERNGRVLKFLAVEIKLVKHVLEGNSFIDFEDLN
jgi:hypothetical protein